MGTHHFDMLFTENNLHNWVGEAQFNRGKQYVRDGLVMPHARRGRSISGWCLPRDGQKGAYYVAARANGVRITHARCTCSLGKHGFCPHVAAVLFTFLRKPESFSRSWWQQLKLKWSRKSLAMNRAG